MSVLSDDTDVLLLIPPDFFLIPSDSEEEQQKKTDSESLIVSDLITQVNDLEGRICFIENRCLSDGVPMAGNLQQMRHFGSADALNQSGRSLVNSRSLQGTPCKGGWSPHRMSDVSPVKRVACPYEMRENILTSSDYVTQKDRDEKLLREIDQFFQQRKSSDGDGSDFCKNNLNMKPELTAAVFNLNRVNDLLKKLDETQKEIEEKVKLKEITGIDADDIPQEKEPDVNEQTLMDESDLSKRVKRVLSFEEDGKEKNLSITSPEFHCGEDGVCVSGKSKSEEHKFEGKGSAELANLLSLSNLWGSIANVNRGTTVTEDESSLRHKIEEERCRRKHCESLIHQLQLHLLEEQQRVAVAMKVDREKDQAISKLTEGWNKLVGHWRDLENQRNNLAKKLLTDREKFKAEISAAYQTVKRYEVELSKALDLAHGYKEKCEASERERKTLRANATKEVEASRGEAKDAIERLKEEESKNEKLEKLLKTKDELVNQGKAKISEMQNQIREGKKTLRELQTELENVRADRDRLGERIKEEKNRAATAEQSKKAVQQQNEELKKKEKVLKDDIKSLTEQMERVKTELKEFYQEQVETIVQEKLREFQDQLAAAEKTLQGEIEVREKAVTEMAVKQVQQIVEKHLQEIGALDEKHKEEANLWKIQIAQKDEKIKDLQKKLEQYSSNKTIIAQRLHSVMETQWQEALKIITSASPQQSKSPTRSAEQLSRQKTFTMTSSSWTDCKSTTSASTASTPFCQEGVVTFREDPKAEPLNYRVDETPQKMSSDHLKKYIKALLERAPGNPTDDSLESTAYKCMDTDESSLTLWQHVLSEQPSDASKFSEGAKSSKPPWK